MKRVAALLMSVWLGVQIGVGYVVAPIWKKCKLGNWLVNYSILFII